ncbi:MAG TPA: YafY family transcriptional regulator [Gammaproteobacteria bacterium]|nr:YafY family transcriptional regulator [Gammaproteobacteria bacterium]
MDKFDRVYELHNLLSRRRRPVPLDVIQESLECSASTARRALNLLRDRLGAPLVYDRGRNGWYYDVTGNERYELPGLWFSPDELYALLVSHQLLAELQPGLLSRYIEPVRARIERLLERRGLPGADPGQRIRILQMAARPTNLQHFRRIATALLQRKRVLVLYHGRERDQTTERIVSPQRLVYYRSNWYLDAWCHLREGFRHFSLDRLHPVEILEEAADEFDPGELDEHFAKAYGIFAGKPRYTAVLRFSPHAARWVADEQWHPRQQGKVLPDGGYELRVPYSDSRELVMDILKYGAEVKVLAPKRLQEQVRQRLQAALAQYGA